MQKATFESKRLTFVQFCSIMEHKRKAIFTMEKKALNRSVRKTRRKLQTSLTQLMQQKPFQEISVRELAEQADINRGTFYLHYHDVNEMVRSIEKELLQSLRDIIHAHTDSTQEPKQRMHAILTDLYQFLEENSEICTELLSPNGDIAFVAKLQEYVQNSCLQEWLDAQQNHPDAVEQEQFHLQTAFIVSGCVGLCRTWLHRTPNPFTATEMAAFTEQLIGDHAI